MNKNINLSNIPVLIFCGGKGIRMREFRPFIPKPLIKIGNKTLIKHIIDLYIGYGCREFYLLTGYKYNNFVNEFKTNSSVKTKKLLKTNYKNSEIKIINTGINSNTGKRLQKMRSLVNKDTFFLTYGDAISNINIKKLFNFHLKLKKIITLTGVYPASRFGNLKLKNNIVTEFNEKPIITKNLVNGGFFVCNKSIFRFLKNSSKNLNFERDILSILAKKKLISCYRHKNIWAAVDHRRDYENILKLWKQNKFKFKS